MSRGAHEIKKVIAKMLGPKLDENNFFDSDFSKNITTKVSSPLRIEKTADCLTISKGASFKQPQQIDFSIKFRVRRNGRDFDLWPVKFTAADGRDVNAELHCDNRVLLNCSIQNDLIKIANTWGKSLATQRVQHGLRKDSAAKKA